MKLVLIVSLFSALIAEASRTSESAAAATVSHTAAAAEDGIQAGNSCHHWQRCFCMCVLLLWHVSRKRARESVCVVPT